MLRARPRALRARGPRRERDGRRRGQRQVPGRAGLLGEGAFIGQLTEYIYIFFYSHEMNCEYILNQLAYVTALEAKTRLHNY